MRERTAIFHNPKNRFQYTLTLTAPEWDEVIGWLNNGNFTAIELAVEIEERLRQIKKAEDGE